MDFKKSLSIKKTMPSKIKDDSEGIVLSKQLSKGEDVFKEPLNKTVKPSNSQKDYDFELIAKIVIKITGKEPIENLKNNENFSFPFTTNSITLTEWVVLALKTLFTFDDLKSLSDNIINHKYTYQEATALVKKRVSNTLIEKNNKIKKLESDMALRKREISKLTDKLDQSTSLKQLIDSFLDSTPENRRLISLLYEAVDDISPDVSEFCMGLFKGWGVFNNSLDKNITESDRMNNIHTSLSSILRYISGKYISQRRDILKELANIANSYLTEHEFVSPEHTLTVDPTLHNASGLGGTEIREGISYSVIRSDTRKTVIYADIVVTD